MSERSRFEGSGTSASSRCRSRCFRRSRRRRRAICCSVESPSSESASSVVSNARFDNEEIDIFNEDVVMLLTSSLSGG